MHKDAVRPGEKVILVDDLIATGRHGTRGACKLLRMQMGAEIVAACFVIEPAGPWRSLEAGRRWGVPFRTLIAFEGH